MLRSTVVLLCVMVAVPSFAQSFNDFRGSNWNDDIQTVINSEGTDFRIVDMIQYTKEDGTKADISLRNEGFVVYEYNRYMLEKFTHVDFVFRSNRLTLALYSLDFTDELTNRLIAALSGKYGDPVSQKKVDLGKQIDASPLMMVDDYLAYTTGGRSLLYGLERLPEQGDKISFYRFSAPSSSVYVFAGIVKGLTIVAYIPRKQDF